MVNIFSSMLFGGISGSAVADISALGSVQIPLMKERGYRPDFAVNVTITSSIAGIIIPPSHNMIIFAVAAGGGISISKLFLAGVIPGVLMCLCLAVAAYVLSLKHQYPAEPFPGVAALGRSSLQALPGLFTAVIIIGGTLSGVFTVTESGAFGAIYALLLTTLHYRSLSWQGFRTAVASSVRTTAMVMILIAFASSFAYLLALYQVPSKLSDLLLAISDNPIVVLLMINVILLLLGMIMDMAALILICTPIFLPIAKSLGMAPEHFGIMLLVNLGIGLYTAGRNLPVYRLRRRQGEDRGCPAHDLAVLPGHSFRAHPGDLFSGFHDVASRPDELRCRLLRPVGVPITALPWQGCCAADRFQSAVVHRSSDPWRASISSTCHRTA